MLTMVRAKIQKGLTISKRTYVDLCKKISNKYSLQIFIYGCVFLYHAILRCSLNNNVIPALSNLFA